jgi:hypothetical protein
MARRATVLLISALAAVLILPPTAFFGAAKYIEHQRVADAEKAFAPLLQLRPVILSQPFPFWRHCRYVVDFPAESRLADENVSMLKSLNRLPPRNTLDVTIRTPNVTDASIPVLESLGSIDLLSVDESAISEAGEERLREKLKDRFVSLRKHAN